MDAISFYGSIEAIISDKYLVVCFFYKRPPHAHSSSYRSVGVCRHNAQRCWGALNHNCRTIWWNSFILSTFIEGWSIQLVWLILVTDVDSEIFQSFGNVKQNLKLKIPHQHPCKFGAWFVRVDKMMRDGWSQNANEILRSLYLSH